MPDIAGANVKQKRISVNVKVPAGVSPVEFARRVRELVAATTQ